MSLSFSRFEIGSRFGACVITLGLAANVLAKVEPGNGSRYGGGGERGFVDATDISIGHSVFMVEFDSLNGFMPGDAGE